MQEVKISVIIPVYNAEKYIEKAVLSAIEQKYVDEIVILDDKSTDNSVQKIQKLKDEYPNLIHFLPQSRNVGAGEIRNIGIQNAKNEWIAFLDVDDYYLENRFENAIEIISNNKSIDGVYEAVENSFENKRAEKRFYSNRPKKYLKKELEHFLPLFTLEHSVSSKELFDTLLKGDIGFIHFNGLVVKKTLFEKTGLLNTRLKLSQDTDIILKMATVGKLVSGNLRKPVAIRLVHDENRVYKDKNRLIYFTILKNVQLYNWAKNNKYVPTDITQKLKNNQYRTFGLLVLKIHKNIPYYIKMAISKLYFHLKISKFLEEGKEKYEC